MRPSDADSNPIAPQGALPEAPVVWVVEDSDLLRDSYVEVLRHAKSVAGARGFRACEDVLVALRTGDPPDIVLMDIGLPGMSGVEGVERIRSVAPDLRVAMLTVHEDRDNVFRSLCAGATGYVVKPDTATGVLDAVEEIRAGGVPMSARIAQKVLAMFRRWAAPSRDYGLTEREVEVLQFLVDGLGQKQIAHTLDLSPHTVNNHIRHIYEKLHVHSRSRVVAKALRERLI